MASPNVQDMYRPVVQLDSAHSEYINPALLTFAEPNGTELHGLDMEWEAQNQLLQHKDIRVSAVAEDIATYSLDDCPKDHHGEPDHVPSTGLDITRDTAVLSATTQPLEHSSALIEELTAAFVRTQYQGPADLYAPNNNFGNPANGELKLAPDTVTQIADALVQRLSLQLSSSLFGPGSAPDLHSHHLVNANTSGAVYNTSHTLLEHERRANLPVAKLPSGPSKAPRISTGCRQRTSAGASSRVRTPSTNLEDKHQENARTSDTDVSWNSDDHNEKTANIYTEIRAIAASGAGDLITGPLGWRVRRAVHGMAHTNKLNHMTIGSGKQRRVLISATEIATEGLDTCKKPWARRAASYRMIPTSIKVKNGPSHGEPEIRDFMNWIATMTDIKPLKVYYQRRVDAPHRDVIAQFEDAEDVAVFVNQLRGKKWGWREAGLAFSYVRERITTTPTGLMDTVREADEEDVELADSTPPQLPYAGYSSGQDSGMSSRGSVGAYSSDASQSRRGGRRHGRLPTIRDGYPCTYDGCVKTFSRAGERRKHERYHQSMASRRHQCPECELRFHEHKDLLRHQLRIHWVNTSDIALPRID